jgi:hypothetical protein
LFFWSYIIMKNLVLAQLRVLYPLGAHTCSTAEW